MQFVSGIFMIFLPIAAIVSWLLPQKARAAWLLLMSVVFYAYAGVGFLIVLLLSVISTYAAGLAIEKIARPAAESAAEKAVRPAAESAIKKADTPAIRPATEKSDGSREDESRKTVSQDNNSRNDNSVIKKKTVLCVCAAFNIGMLVFFKYLGMLGIKTGLAVPLGISFYILQAVGYIADVYTGKIQAEHNILYYALFVSFFPQIISGPIERAGNILPQLKEKPAFSSEPVKDGFYMMLWGYLLKLVLADRIGTVVDSVYASSDSYGGLVVLLSFVLYSFQIYCDFAGYSSIAIGCARVMGIRLMDNFRSPYMSGSIAEFWRRWHISLSSWLRDYVYIPLGGNRKGTIRKYINVLVVFLISGIWHGAGITFMIWGILHGVYQIIGKLLMPLRDAAVNAAGTDRNVFSHRLFKTVFTFMLVTFAWVFFRSPDIKTAFHMMGRVFSGMRPWELTDGTLLKLGLDLMNLVITLCGIGILIAVDAVSFYRGSQRGWLMKQEIWFRYLVIAGTIVFIAVCGIWGPSYEAASFIYSQF